LSLKGARVRISTYKALSLVFVFICNTLCHAEITSGEKLKTLIAITNDNKLCQYLITLSTEAPQAINSLYSTYQQDISGSKSQKYIKTKISFLIQWEYIEHNKKNLEDTQLINLLISDEYVSLIDTYKDHTSPKVQELKPPQKSRIRRLSILPIKFRSLTSLSPQKNEFNKKAAKKSQSLYNMLFKRNPEK